MLRSLLTSTRISPPLSPLRRPLVTRAAVTHTPLTTRLINFSKLSGILIGLLGTSIYLSDTRAGLHSWVGVPLIKALASQDPEEAHELAIRLLKFIGAHHLIRDKGVDGEQLAVQLWGKQFSNPIGIAAGFDKHADAIDGLFDIGFGYVEIGSVTPEPQTGNPKPRLFRLPSTNSVINRYGFNSEGHLVVLTKLRNRLLNYIHQHRYLSPQFSLTSSSASTIGPFMTPLSAESISTEPLDNQLSTLLDEFNLPRSLTQGRVLGVNLGKNKSSAPDTVEDFTLGIQRLGPLADVLVINVSSPNTPGLRGLQSKDLFRELLAEIVRERDRLPTRPALLVKVAPDLSYSELVDIGQAAREAKINGIIVSNTTVSRPAQAGTDSSVHETGGLSGPALKPLALRALSIIYSTTDGKVPLIGCGGISNGKDALDYAQAGASLVQLYTSLTYEGIGLPRRVKDELKELLGDRRWEDVVGSQANKGDGIEEGIEEAGHQLAYIQQRLDAHLARSRSTPVQSEVSASPVEEVPVPRSTPSSSGIIVVGTGEAAPVPNSTSFPSVTSLSEKDGGSEEVGILAGWKLRRRREAESGEDPPRRIV